MHAMERGREKSRIRSDLPQLRALCVRCPAVSHPSCTFPFREVAACHASSICGLYSTPCPKGGARFQHNMTMVIDGDTGVEHSLPIGRVYDEVVPRWCQVHGQREGLGAHWEILSMVLGGMSPHEALSCATLGGALRSGGTPFRI